MPRWEYKIEAEHKGKSVPLLGYTGGLEYLRGVLAHHREAPGPRLAYRIVRSDGRVMEIVSSREEASIGMVLGWPTANQYAQAAINALGLAIRTETARFEQDGPISPAAVQVLKQLVGKLTGEYRRPIAERGEYRCDGCAAVEPYGGDAETNGAHGCGGRWRAFDHETKRGE